MTKNISIGSMAAASLIALMSMGLVMADESAVSAGRLQALYGVTYHTGHAAVIEFSIDLRIFSERAAQHADRVVTTIAVP